MSVALEDATLAVLASRLRSGHLRSAELLEACLERIESERDLNAVVERDADGARRAAREADRLLRTDAAVAGPLCGLPVTVKRTFEVLGYPHLEQDVAPGTEFGRPATRDAAVVAAARTAGAIVLGRTNAPPRAADIDTWHPAFGRTTHPVDPGLSPGGSSGGSAAAVAAGHTTFDIASDDAGSARIPAQLCGVYALRPTPGAIPAFGHVPGPLTDTETPETLCASLIARHAADLGFLWRALGPAAAGGASGPVAAVLTDRGAPMSLEVGETLRAAVMRLRSAGHRIDDVDLPVDLAENWLLCQQLLYADDDPADDDLYGDPGGAHDLPEQTSDATPIEIAWWCAGMSHDRRLGLRRARAALRARWQRFFAGYTALLTPVMGLAALAPRDQRVPLLVDDVVIDGAEVPTFSLSVWCALASVAGLPAATMPVRDPVTGTAAAFQVLAGPGRETALLDVVERLSAALADPAPSRRGRS